jgi:ElaB/YqjD/DUF883 family membrane-anchored ribosome-binding protein
MNANTDNRSADEIERDIRATQEDMSRTVEQIEGEFTGRNILDSLLDKADQNGVDARYLIDAARRNPLALGMIAAGGLWLVSDADARPSALKMSSGRSGSNYGMFGNDSWHPEHRTYIDHMARCERQPGEDDQSYRRRRDQSRADYFMLEQRHDEDEHTFRQRLDDATENLRSRFSKASDSAHDMADRSRESAKQAASKAQGFYFDNPLISGLAAAFVGAIAGSALPATRAEEDYVGGMGEKAIDAAKAQARKTGEEARHQKDEMIDQVDRKMERGSQQYGQSETSQAI